MEHTEPVCYLNASGDNANMAINSCHQLWIHFQQLVAWQNCENRFAFHPDYMSAIITEEAKGCGCVTEISQKE